MDDDKKLSILNMKCLLEDMVLYFQHYEKTISSKRLIPYRSAHTSTRLSWDDYFVPMLRSATTW